MLTQPDIASYLIRRRLVAPQTLVDGDLSILDASRRNANFQVLSEHGLSYLVKQGLGPERAATVAHEAAMYHWLHTSPAARPLRRYLPGFHRYDAAQQVLVLEFLPAARTLGAYHEQGGRFATTVAAALGGALAALHGVAPGAEPAPIPARPAPWVLDVHRPTIPFYCEISWANVQLIRTIQQFPPFGQALAALRQEWQPQALVHYDLKGENVLVLRRPRHRPALKLIDWESAGWGDPCWDIGAVFGEYLSFWLLSIPLVGGGPPDQFLELARYPLVKIQPALRRFWQAYAARARLDAATADAWLGRAVRYGAARLIQTAFEQSQPAAQLTANAIAFLQLSFNILQRPQEAAVHLLGIPWQPAWTS